MSGQKVVIRRTLAATPEEVYDAWLDSAGMRVWMCPGPVTSCDVDLEPRVGGSFRIVMAAPGAKIVNTGQFRVLERPKKLQFTWISSRWAFQETLVTVELNRHEEQCELTLIHERFPMGHSSDQLEKGWSQILDKLAAHLPTSHR